MHIPFSPPDLSECEINEVIETIRSGWVTTGPKVKLFERRIAEYCATERAVCFISATSAMEMTLRLLGIGPGDEVITSAYTFTASASAIHHVGARIVLVDTAPDSFQLDIDQVADAITERTKAIIPVDIGGVMCDYDRLLEAVEDKKHLFCPGNNVYLKTFDRPVILADGAHSFGAVRHGKRSGAAADFTCFSFHAVKNLTTAEGGAITWIDHEGISNEKLYGDFRLISLHGVNKDAAHRENTGSWEYDVRMLGYKANMTDIQASIGLAQLKRFEGMVKRRKEIVRQYDAAFLPYGIQRLEHFGRDYEGNAHLYLMRIPGITENRRNALIRQIMEEGVTCNVHFKPLPMHTAYRNLGFDIARCPNAYHQYANEISIPLYSLLQCEQVEYIIQTIESILGKNCGKLES